MGERDVRKVLQRLRQEERDEFPGKGNHIIFRKAGEPTISVPTGDKELKKGTYDDIAKKAGWK